MIKMTISELKQLLSYVTPFYQNRNPLHQSRFFQLHQTKNNWTVTYFNGETKVQTVLSHSNSNAMDTVICLPLQECNQLAQRITSSMVSFVQEQHQIILRSGGSKFVLQGTTDTFDFSMPNLSGDVILVRAEPLKMHYKSVLYSASKAEQSGPITGVHHQIQDQKLKLIATDRHRLALRTLQIESNQNVKATIHHGIIKSLMHAFDDQDTIQIKLTTDQFEFKNEKVTIVSPVFADVYPDVNRVIPVAFTQSIKLETTKLKEAILRLSVFLNEKQRSIGFIIRPENRQIRLFIENEQGTMKEDLNLISGNGEPSIHFLNANYILDILNHSYSKEITFQMNKGLVPIVFEAQQNDCFDLALPVRAQSTMSLELSDFEVFEHEFEVSSFAELISEAV